MIRRASLTISIRARALALVPLLLGVGACIANTQPSRPGEETKPLVVACPLGVSSTRIRVADTADGVDLIFTTTTTSAVDELRQRVNHQVARHGPERREGLGHGGRHGYGHGHGLRLWSMPKTQASVVNEPMGARLVLLPADPRERDALREAAIRRVAHLEAQGCPD